MTTSTAQQLTRSQDELLDRIHEHWRNNDARAQIALHAINRATATDVPVHPDVLDDYPHQPPTRQDVLDDALAAWDVQLNAARKFAGNLVENTEWLYLLGHDDAHQAILNREHTATGAYYAIVAELATAIRATHACDPLLADVHRAVDTATEPVTADDVYGLLLGRDTIDHDPKNRVLVRLALVVLTDDGAIAEPAPGGYVPVRESQG